MNNENNGTMIIPHTDVMTKVNPTRFTDTSFDELTDLFHGSGNHSVDVRQFTTLVVLHINVVVKVEEIAGHFAKTYLPPSSFPHYLKLVRSRERCASGWLLWLESRYSAVHFRLEVDGGEW
jgi:hypothetical protein